MAIARVLANDMRILNFQLGLEHVLLVSHQPLVGTLVGMLEHGHGQQPAPLSTATLAELEGDWPLAGLMTLHGLYHAG